MDSHTKTNAIRRELEVPPAATSDPDSFEILRLWAAGGALHVSIRSTLNGGPEQFGRLLADLVRHGARMYSQQLEVPNATAVAQIFDGMRRELREDARHVSGSISHDA